MVLLTLKALVAVEWHKLCVDDYEESAADEAAETLEAELKSLGYAAVRVKTLKINIGE